MPHKPELKPLDKGVQGSSKLDCVTVWFFGEKIKFTKSPGFAVCRIKSMAQLRETHWELCTYCDWRGIYEITIMIADLNVVYEGVGGGKDCEGNNCGREHC